MITREVIEIKPGFLIDFTLISKKDKKDFLKKNINKKIVSDLSCFNLEEFYDEFPNLVGSMSSLFSDEHKKIEVHFRESQSVFESYLRDQQFLLYPIKKTSGFIVPRTIATIVNEAYFALEERIATKTDIDRAMKFGVNYPKGPFEWAKDCKQAIVWTLEDLYSTTKDERYLISQLLKMEIK